MNLRARSLLGALVLCALAISAFGAASASAAGMTAVECKKVPAGTGTFNNNHCITPEAVGGEWKTEKYEGPVSGKGTVPGAHHSGSTAEPVAIFHSVVGGIPVTITCGKAVSSGGKVVNIAGPPMQIHGTEAVATYSECHASTETGPTKICTVQGTAPATAVGEIQTNKTTGISGEEHKVSIKPEGETPFTEFKINASGGECFTKVSLPIKVTGEAMGTADTKTHSHLTIAEPWPCGGAGQPACGGLKANAGKAAQTVTGTGFKPGNEEETVGATTETEFK